MARHEDFGRRLMPQVLQDEAKSNPGRIFASISRSGDLKDGFRDITFAEMSSAVDAMAHFVVENIGQPATKSTTLTYLGLPDIGYNIVFYAAVKVGYKVLLPSPRNPIAINLSLMEQTASTKLLFSPELKMLVEPLQAQILELACVKIPATETLLSSQADTFPFDKSFDEAEADQILVLHSSGSTGIPKPIVMTHGTFAVLDNDRNFPRIPGRMNHDLTVWDFDVEDARIYEPFPPFHLAGFFNKIMVPLFTHTIPIFGPPTRPPSGALAAEIMRSQHVRGSILPPVVAEQLYQEQGGFETLKTLDVLCFAGGPLSQVVGDELAKHTVLCQFYGSTEIGQVRQLIPEREDWSYMQFHPSMKFELQEAEDDAYELVLFADESTKASSALNHNFPGVTEWRTKDLFRPHPTKPDLWRFHARRDDIIVLSNGEKLNPIPIEGALTAVPEVSGALVVGQGRSYPVLLVELKSGTGMVSDPLEHVWPAVEKANLLIPTYGRITSSAIIIAQPDKPFIRAGKGTVIRKLTESAYDEEIQAFYSRSSHRPSLGGPVLKLTEFTHDAVKELLHTLIIHIAPELKLDSDDENIYTRGMDSRATMELASQLKISIGSQRNAKELEWLAVDFIYNNPTIAQLTDQLLQFLNEGIQPRGRDRTLEMRATLQAYTKDLAFSSKEGKMESDVTSLTVALTGTTGFTGSRLLLSLMKNPRVSKIYCLNRSLTAEEQWQEAVKSSSDKVPQKSIQFMRINLGSAFLGLSSAEYKEISQTCDLFIHNAWTVDFNWSFSSFGDNLKGVRSIVDLGSQSKKQLRIVFLSTIAATGLWSLNASNKIVPEASVKDLNESAVMGYAESKLVAEQILQAAADIAGIPVTILRVGQIGPSTDRADTRWPELDLITAVLRTSKKMGAIPSDIERIDWVPIDKLVLIVEELAIHDLQTAPKHAAQYYNIVNPNPSNTSWDHVLSALQSWCGSATRAVPFATWLTELVGSGEKLTPEGQKSLPALRMRHFVNMIAARGPWAMYETNRAQAASMTLKTLPSIDARLIEQWTQGL